MPPDFAEKVTKALVAADDARPRSSQGAGISSLGDCPRRVWHMLRKDEAVNPDVERLPAILGTAIHKAIEDALQGQGHNELEVYLDEVELPGHVDHIDGAELVDWKTTTLAGLRWIKAHGPSRNQRWQIHAGAYAVNQMALSRSGMPEIERVSLVFIPRDGKTKDVLVWEEDYDEAVARDAIEWMAMVRRAVAEGIVPAPEKHFSYCANWCQFWGALCPGLDASDPLDEVEDSWLWEAADAYLAALEDEKEATETKASARDALDGFTGVLVGDGGRFHVTWVRNRYGYAPRVRRLLGGGENRGD